MAATPQVQQTSVTGMSHADLLRMLEPLGAMTVQVERLKLALAATRSSSLSEREQLPAEFNSAMFVDEKADGETIHLMLYIRLRAGLGDGFRADQDPANGAELLKRFVMRAEQDKDVAHCFKMIGVFQDLEAVKASGKVPGAVMTLVNRFNGKPVLTRPEHNYARDAQNRYLAVDCDGHQMKYLTRSGIAKGIPSLAHVQINYGYVVEARKEAELPEVMAACCTLCHVDLSKAPRFPPPPGGPK